VVIQLFNSAFMLDGYMKICFSIITLLFVFLYEGCAPAMKGPDKRGAGILSGAASGAITGAVYGVQISAGSGPGALVGAGIGAGVGAVKGAIGDELEHERLLTEVELRNEEERAKAHSILVQHYQKMLKLHPTRDIYPADIFFEADSVKLKPQAKYLVYEISRLNKNRLPWSRLVLTSYAKANDVNSEYAKYLVMERARELANYFIRAGIEPRRIEARGVVTDAPLLIDPNDDPTRYNQVIEILPVDR
ncbi:MAG: hypothetical protein D6808_04630, partial [Candidatus Dadabacteria bacterium]